MRAVAFNHDGSLVASASDDGTVRLWDLQHTHAPPSVLDGGGRQAVYSGPEDPPPLGRPPSVLGRDGQADAIAFNPDGSLLASVHRPGLPDPGADGTIYLWDPHRPRLPPVVLTVPKNRVSAVAFNRDGSLLAGACDDGFVRFWNPWEPVTSPVVLAGHEGAVNAVAFNHDGTVLASASNDGTVRLWDPHRPDLAPVTALAFESTLQALAWNPHSDRLAASGARGIFWMQYSNPAH